MVDLSTVIVSYNTRQLLRACLNSLPDAAGGLEHEVFVVDNTSSDGSPEMVEEEFPWVHLVRSECNLGFAGGNNEGLRRASGRCLLLLNPDTVTAPKALAELVAFMDSHPQAGYCGPKLVNPDGSHQPSARRFPTPISPAFSMLGLAVRRPKSRHAIDLHLQLGSEKAFAADWLSGACLMVRREVIEQVGLLDDGFFLYFEETDWCRRMAAAGWQGWYVPSAQVMHFGGQSVSQAAAVGLFSGNHPVYWTLSSRRYLRKHHGWAAAMFSRVLQTTLFGTIWARHAWRGNLTSERKAGAALASIRYLLTPTSSPRLAVKR